jgi:rhamnose transport system ATP-binding protein
MREQFRLLSEMLDVAIDPNAIAASLSIADQQSLEIMRGLAVDARVLILDEPTASIGMGEREALYAAVRKLRAKGVAILLISHDMDEVLALSDRVTVLRDGRTAGSRKRNAWTKAGLIQAMLGESSSTPAATESAPRAQFGLELLRAENVHVPGKVYGVSVSLRSGEILGIAGLIGSGRTELLSALVGMQLGSSGELSIRGRAVGWPKGPRMARNLGIALAPEDRKHQGLVLGLSSFANVTLTNPWRASRFGVLSNERELARARPVTERLALQKGALLKQARALSGGNQQKLVLAKWLEAAVDILLVDEPTRGVDVGAKVELFNVLANLARSGVAIILVSSEIEEVLSHSDRVVVLSRGRLIGELEGRKSTKEEVLKMIFASEEMGG